MTDSPYSTEADAFRAAIIAAPEDDAPRLVYCDWLDEHGVDQLASFIRWQIRKFRENGVNAIQRANGKVSECGYDGRFYTVEEEVAADTFAWFYSFSENVVGPHTGWTWTWRRGFVEKLIMPADAVWEHLPDLRKLHPITKVVVNEAPRQEVAAWLVQSVPTVWKRREDGPFVMSPDGQHVFPYAADRDGWQTRLRALFWTVKFEFRIPERQEFRLEGLPLPITHSDFTFTRHLMRIFNPRRPSG